MKYTSTQGQGHLFILALGRLHMKIETCFCKKPLDHFQPNLVCKLLENTLT